jgi:hypothetical protein
MIMKKKVLKTILYFSTVLCFNLMESQTPLKSHKYRELITDYLNNKKADYGLFNKDLETLLVTDSYTSKTTGVSYVYIQQTFQSIKIYNAVSSFAIKNNDVFYFSNRFVGRANSKVNSVIPTIAPEVSVANLVSHFQLGELQAIQQIERYDNMYVFSNGSVSNRNITAELVLLNTEDELKLAWDIMIYAKDNSHWYSVRVDALTNTVLESNDLILNCTFGTHSHKEANKKPVFSLFKSNNSAASVLVDGSVYNVFTLPTESPNHGLRQIVTNPSSVLASPFGWHDTDGIFGPEFTTTRGNNVIAREDRNGADSNLGFSPDGGNTLNFNFPLDINQPPSGYEDVAITNLFYTNNMMHDIWYHHGFDEASGNFQANNYGNLGFGNDHVIADAQDGSGLNNATFGTPPDGINPIMTMFLWSPSGPLNQPLTINTGTVAGSYNGTQAGFGSELMTTPIIADLVLVNDNSLDTADACQPLNNDVNINGNIAVIRRGGCEFGFKVLAAENAGAVAAIVVNNQPDGTFTMGSGANGAQVTIPSIMVSQADGEAIIAALLNNESLNTSLVNNGPFLIDGDFDNGIIAHEFGHGISTRLNSGPSNVGCLFNDEQMGEGWSDWFGLMVTIEPGDLGEDIRGIGTFAISQSTTGNGIRPVPYSTDFSINPFTYGDTNNVNLSQPHGIGFVWSTVLWDLTWAYIDKYGFDSDLFNGNGGNNRVMRLVIEGLKLQPCEPGFIDGRDALLAADLAATGGEDQCMIWEVFARRGLGFNASQGFSTSRTDQIEDFSLPPTNDPSLANCSSLSIDEVSIEDTIKIYPNPANDQLFISTTISFDDVLVSLIDINGRVVLNKTLNLSNKNSINITQLESGVYIVNILSKNFNYKKRIVKN